MTRSLKCRAQRPTAVALFLFLVLGVAACTHRFTAVEIREADLHNQFASFRKLLILELTTASRNGSWSFDVDGARGYAANLSLDRKFLDALANELAYLIERDRLSLRSLSHDTALAPEWISPIVAASADRAGDRALISPDSDEGIVMQLLGTVADGRSASIRVVAPARDAPAMFDSVRHLMRRFDTSRAETFIGNVSQGSKTRAPVDRTAAPLAALRRELEGLRYVDAIVWEESVYLAERRHVIRSGGDWPGTIPLPSFDRSPESGASRLPLRQIHYMQDSADDASGPYTVIGNARSIRTGGLSPDDLPPLEVWRDTTGKVWSLDHRRLAAYDLSGVVEEVPVVFVSEEAVQADAFKLTNADDGRSILIQLEASDLAYIVVK